MAFPFATDNQSAILMIYYNINVKIGCLEINVKCLYKTIFFWRGSL